MWEKKGQEKDYKIWNLLLRLIENPEMRENQEKESLMETLLEVIQVARKMKGRFCAQEHKMYPKIVFIIESICKTPIAKWSFLRPHCSY